VVQVVGLEKFGIISIAQYLTQYFNVAVDYGFNLIATQEISINEGDQDRLSQITSTAIVLKLILLMISFIIFIAIIASVPSYSKDFTTYFLSFFIVVAQGLSINWFFQGVQKIQIMAVFNVIFRTLSTVSIFIFIREPADFLWVNFIIGVGNLCASVGLLYWLVYKLRVKITKPKVPDLINSLKTGWDIFLANFYISIYNNSNAIILSFFVPKEIVGLYSVIEKVINVLRQIIGVFMQAIYPTACKLAKEGKMALLSFLKPAWAALTLVIIISCTLIHIFAENIITFIIGNSNGQATLYLKILNGIPIIVFISTYFLTILLAFGKTRFYKKITLIASITNIIANLVLTNYFLINGTIASIYLTEVIVLVSVFIFYKNNKLKLI
jgi:PST family polysaccharide transporter